MKRYLLWGKDKEYDWEYVGSFDTYESAVSFMYEREEGDIIETEYMIEEWYPEIY